MALEAFIPAGTVTVAASTTSATAPLVGSGDTVVVFNASAGIAFVQFGVGTVTATVAGYPVPAGGSRIIKIGPLASAVGVILSTGTGNVYVSIGIGAQY